MTDLSSLLACPRCGTPLSELRCTACRVTFPRHGNIPWLFADPGAAVSEWKSRWRLALAHMQADLARVESALAAGTADAGTELPPATCRRLERLASGYRAQREHLQSLLAPLEQASGGSLETLLALRTRLPPAQGIFSYEANVHRDWCWGAEECEAAVTDVLGALDGRAATHILVLGAGAGRLAYDLHQRTAARVTVALDLNPLLACVGYRLAAGETVALVEFPLAPFGPEDAAIPRLLEAPAPARPGLEFLLADAVRPPFLPEKFDLVVTPWLLDVLDVPAERMVRQVNQLLEVGGTWINQGSVAFDRPDPAERLTLEELDAVCRQRGFEAVGTIERELPYMNCPASRHGRVERVVTTATQKAAACRLPARHERLPDWIVGGRSPIPALPSFRTQAMTTRMHAFLMTLIDGERSLTDMARILEEQNLMPRKEAEAALRGFLIRMYEEAERTGRPPL